MPFRLGALLGACLLLLGLSAAAHADPLLYVYRGAGCTGVAGLPQTRAMLGRQEDGVDDFADFGQGRAGATSETDWALGCWQGKVKNIAYAIGLAFADTTTAQVAAGAADAQYAHMAASLVSHGFPNAYVRLGWEMNGGWYPWGRTGATYVAAFRHVVPIIRKACPGCRIIWNPTAGTTDPSSEWPGDDVVDVVADDDYVNSWNSGGPTTEPGISSGDLTSWWGMTSLLKGPRGYNTAKHDVAIPELGVGSRSDGHGACTSTASTGCDDPVGLSALLAAGATGGSLFNGFWDYDAGDYNSQVSSGERPGEALVLMHAYGSANLRTILTAHATQPYAAVQTPAVTCVDPTGAVACHYALELNAPGHYDLVVWAGAAHPSVKVSWGGRTTNANVYDPSKGLNPVQTLGPASSATVAFKGGDQFVIGISQ